MRAGADDAFSGRGADLARDRTGQGLHLDGAQHAVRIGRCGHCQLGPTLVCRDEPVFRWPGGQSVACDQGAVISTRGALPTGVEKGLPVRHEGDGRRALRRVTGRGLDHHMPSPRSDPSAASDPHSDAGPTAVFVAGRPHASRTFLVSGALSLQRPLTSKPVVSNPKRACRPSPPSGGPDGMVATRICWSGAALHPQWEVHSDGHRVHRMWSAGRTRATS